ncbi:type I-C CRISPR-associated protein Cas8c/Csd1 [Campylobacter sp. VBCF_05 NA6]|uniref:type I-C CRISPR-associated protein Cas8c/Csd1 n=1 Tax=unclassified Campylobacter TaxID=2593542 RepID=UPI0022E9F4EE|nr:MULTISPECIES: type I-C CRISPR-associated protein Cas8c/Csd1 [unclassified Campylobacter]MDA3057605.1 type I-C CRISPR-associated protein Cas8c/Csd1 [Campylobacter sp. VBCF_04 NA7]MDA3058506.1 type I-C CRISPR-associated protein Cas8c/Csd1 [Campylobacter sp. VBCF_05 NA6]
MLISALCEYYDVLASKGRAIKDGYSSVEVDYLICLSLGGEMQNIINIQEKVQNGKKEVLKSKSVIMPQRSQKPGIDANIIEHRSLYIFGLNYENDELTPNDKTQKAKKSHDDFVSKNLEFFSDINSDLARAFAKFIQNWEPQNEVKNEHLLNLGKKLSTAKFAFCLSGAPDRLLHDDKAVLEKWEAKFTQDSENKDEIKSQCAILGQNLSLARIHNKISGIKGGQASGTSLVSFNNPCDESYAKSQAFNSNISELAMKKYTQSLNFLLSSPKNHIFFDDLTIIFWASDANEKAQDLMSALFGDKLDSQNLENLILNLLKNAREANLLKEQLNVQGIDENTNFYILGIKPNASRLSLKFIYKNAFAKVLENIATHQQDLQTSNEFKKIPLWQLKNELKSPNSGDEALDPSLGVKIFESIVQGANYPAFLLEKAILRAKIDKNITQIKAGIIKAYLNRKSRLNNQREEIKMSLDKENLNHAYLCGRLFAVLEKVQEKASGGGLNRTIKDAYFGSAMSNPAAVFPNLLRLYGIHLKKIDKEAFVVFYEKLVGEIMDKLGSEFKKTLLLDEQGKFILGYYQQIQDFYTKKGDKDEQ